MNIFTEYSQDEYGFTWRYVLMNICMNTLFLGVYLKCLHCIWQFFPLYWCPLNSCHFLFCQHCSIFRILLQIFQIAYQSKKIYHDQYMLPETSQVALVVKNPPAKAGDIREAGSVPGSGRSPGGGRGNPLQHSCLETPTDRGAWRATLHSVAQSRTQLQDFSTHALWKSTQTLRVLTDELSQSEFTCMSICWSLVQHYECKEQWAIYFQCCILVHCMNIP